MRFFFLVLMVIVSSVLFAQAEDSLSQDSTFYSSQPIESALQHNLQAYQYMLAGQYRTALEEYQLALKINSADSDAWKGILWANNSLANWKETIRTGHTYLDKFGYDADVLLYIAFASSANAEYFNARYYYQWSSKYLGWFGANTNGIAWTYRLLGNYAKEQIYIRKWEKIVPDSVKFYVPQPPDPLYLGHVQLAYAAWSEQGKAFSHHYTLRYQTISLTSGMEEIWQNQTHLRSDYLASLKWDTVMGAMEWRGHWLKGDYENLYPAFSHRFSMGIPVYIKNASYVPEISASYSNYPVLSSYQGELKQSYVRDAWWISGSAAMMYHDYDNPGADKKHQWYILDIGTRIFPNLTIDIYTGIGDNTFYVGREIGVIDNYIASKSQYGISVLYKIRKMNVGFNYSTAKQTNNEKSSTVSMTLGLDYSLHVKRVSVPAKVTF